MSILPAVIVTLLSSVCGFAGDTVTARGSCDQPPSSYDGKFTIRDVSIHHPFDFLRFVSGRRSVIAGSDKLPKKGDKLDLAKVRDGRDSLFGQFFPLPFYTPVRLDVVIAALQDCRDGQLDVVYSIYSMQPTPVFGLRSESREEEQKEPQKAAGLDTDSPFRLVPTLRYDRTTQLAGGGQLQWRARKGWLQSANAEGRGSSTSRFVTAGMEGGAELFGPVARAEWRLDYTYEDTPTAAGNLRRANLALRGSGQTNPLGANSVVLRFGTSLEGGYRQSGFFDSELAADTLANSGYGSLKLYGGFSARPPHQAVSASYGLELGTLGASTDIQFRKHIGDVAYAAWIPAGDHREIEFAARMTAGGIQVPGRIPVAERFFGGNMQRDFIPGDSWQIRANPVLRSIPANRYFRVEDGAGADRFIAMNFTGAVPIWRMPLVPSEVSTDQEFKDALDLELSIVPGLLASEYASRDANFQKAVGELPALMDRLTEFEAAVSAATIPSTLEALGKDCKLKVLLTRIALRDFRTKKGEQLFSLVNSMVDPDKAMDKALKVCIADLNSQLKDPGVDQRGQALSKQVGVVKTSADQVPLKEYEDRAAAETKPILRVVNTVINQLNVYSISPVAVYDVARIGKFQPGTAGGWRHGIGGGVRLTLANSASLTLGYAVNANRRPGEGRGALFFELSFRDLFQ